MHLWSLSDSVEMARSRSLKCTRANVGAQLEIELSSARGVASCLYNVLGDCNVETIRSEAGSLAREGGGSN